MDIGKSLFHTFRENGHMTTIWLYPATETVNDPYEKTTTRTFLNPVPVEGVVKDITPSSLRWKFQGILPGGSKSIICEKKYKVLFKIAKKIKIGDSFYQVYVDDSKGWGLLEREEYLVVVLIVKNDTGD